MNSYILLLRGINVGGKNKVPMTELVRSLEELGCTNVFTYINSGNVLLQSKLDAKTLEAQAEKAISQNFNLDSLSIKVLVLASKQLAAVVENKPEGFGEESEKYHSDVIFLMGINETEAMSIFNPREGVDKVWPGDGVIYSQRLSALRTKSRLSQIMGTPAYQSMTIRSWNTTTKLLALGQVTKSG